MTDTIKIGSKTIARTAALAPMAGVADRAYRLMCKKYGAAYVVSEMVSAKGICYSDRKTARTRKGLWQYNSSAASPTSWLKP